MLTQVDRLSKHADVFISGCSGLWANTESSRMWLWLCRAPGLPEQLSESRPAPSLTSLPERGDGHSHREIQHGEIMSNSSACPHEIRLTLTHHVDLFIFSPHGFPDTWPWSQPDVPSHLASSFFSVSASCLHLLHCPLLCTLVFNILRALKHQCASVSAGRESEVSVWETKWQDNVDQAD